jgi:hypothetical protein
MWKGRQCCHVIGGTLGMRSSYATHTLAIRRVRWSYAVHTLTYACYTLTFADILCHYAVNMLAIRYS